jgi:hypothetical protein
MLESEGNRLFQDERAIRKAPIPRTGITTDHPRSPFTSAMLASMAYL